MSQEKLLNALTDVFHDVFDDDNIVLRPEMTAADVEEWDSLNHVRLIVATEKEFGVRFSTTEINSLENVGQFVSLIAEKRAR
ncbi:MAG: acyl carrier protein [Alphaproteobacteria bacterium RIFOXYD12_FULL_60_8]|nr:MAG: acyl carrier protein [Alphaproteobacteria bacterium RIFOXYD12_FULL_60_8]